MKKKLLDFQASISDIIQLNPLFSTCKVRVMYTGKNRNMSTISKETVETALPTLYGIPIVGEYSVENADFKGHGGAIDLSDFKYIHTTKPYGFVPREATYEWIPVKEADGTTHEYLEVSGCILWTGRYEEALEVIQKSSFGQSMEIQVEDGEWDSVEESFVIKDFIFSAFCILGNEYEPAFESASITAYSLDKDSFKQEFTQMLDEFKSFQNKEGNNMNLKELLEKYSLTMEQVTEKGIVLDGLSEEELEAKIIEVFEIKPEGGEPPVDPPIDNPPTPEKYSRTFELSHDDVRSTLYQLLDTYLTDNELIDGVNDYFYIVDVFDTYTIVEIVDYVEVQDNGFYQVNYTKDENDNIQLSDNFQVFPMFMTSQEKDTIEQMRANQQAMMDEMMSLRQFKADIEKAEKQTKVDKMFADFQLTDVDTEGLDVETLSLEEIEEKCFAILGKKLVTNKNFSKTNNGIHLPINNGSDDNHGQNNRYGNLLND